MSKLFISFAARAFHHINSTLFITHYASSSQTYFESRPTTLLVMSFTKHLLNTKIISILNRDELSSFLFCIKQNFAVMALKLFASSCM